MILYISYRQTRLELRVKKIQIGGVSAKEDAGFIYSVYNLEEALAGF
jgi:hypothetical protein